MSLRGDVELFCWNMPAMAMQIADRQSMLFQVGCHMRARDEANLRMVVQTAAKIIANHPGAVDGDAQWRGHATAAAAARPATRPENRQPPRKLPSSAR